MIIDSLNQSAKSLYLCYLGKPCLKFRSKLEWIHFKNKN